MIEQLEIKGFRCFKNVQLEKLRRFNVIVGGNASGKTALLEAIFLASIDSVDKALQFRVRRGLGEQIEVGFSKAAYEALWNDLFFSVDQPIHIALTGSRNLTRSVAIGYGKEPLRLPLGQVPIDATAIMPIEFTWVGADKVSHPRRPELTEKGINFGGPVPPGLQVAYFSPGPGGRIKDSAEWFSTLSKRNEEGVVSDAVREEFPFIEDLSIETYYGGQSMVYAKVRGLREKLPLGMVSEGISRTVHILVGIASRPHGVVLVDEIENGLYYESLRGIWSTLLKFCKRHDVQLFASTHSMECIKALDGVVASSPDEICLIRAKREDGQSLLRQFQGTDVEAAVEQGFEIR